MYRTDLSGSCDFLTGMSERVGVSLDVARPQSKAHVSLNPEPSTLTSETLNPKTLQPRNL